MAPTCQTDWFAEPLTKMNGYYILLLLVLQMQYSYFLLGVSITKSNFQLWSVYDNKDV